MLRTVKDLVRRAVAAALDLHTTEDLREAQAAQEKLWTGKVDAYQAENEQLRTDLAQALDQRVSEAVNKVDCPRCRAITGDRCRDDEGKTLRRTQLLDLLAPLPATQAPVASEAAPAPAEGSEVAEVVVVPKSPEELARESIVQDLLWLTHEGYVVEYADGRLESVPPPRGPPKPPEPSPQDIAAQAERQQRLNRSRLALLNISI